MARFFFHLHECGALIEDEEGRELADIGTALDCARHDARALLAAEVQEGRMCLECHIEVVAEDSGEVFLVPFRPLVRIVGG